MSMAPLFGLFFCLGVAVGVLLMWAVSITAHKCHVVIEMDGRQIADAITVNNRRFGV